MSENYAIKTALDGALRIVEFDLRKHCIARSDFDELENWLATESDGSIILNLDNLDHGVVTIYQNRLQYRTTTIVSTQHKVERIIQGKQLSEELDL